MPPTLRTCLRVVQRYRPAGTVKLGGLSLGGGSEVGYPRPMTTPRDPLYSGYRYPAELISYAVWLYFRFPLSLRMVEEMLAVRGISVTYETIRDRVVWTEIVRLLEDPSLIQTELDRRLAAARTADPARQRENVL